HAGTATGLVPAGQPGVPAPVCVLAARLARWPGQDHGRAGAIGAHTGITAPVPRGRQRQAWIVWLTIHAFHGNPRKNDMLIPLILSGGSGTRLWPVSRKNLPKQFLQLAGRRT